MYRLIWWRTVTKNRCKGGRSLATPEEFETQALVAKDVLNWYGKYVTLHKLWHGNVKPSALVAFCGQGGVTEGVVRAGGSVYGQDLRPQPRYKAKYGEHNFS